MLNEMPIESRRKDYVKLVATFPPDRTFQLLNPKKMRLVNK
jgi:hypothetical protein